MCTHHLLKALLFHELAYLSDPFLLCYCGVSVDCIALAVMMLGEHCEDVGLSTVRVVYKTEFISLRENV